jgi:hypothetical protein
MKKFTLRSVFKNFCHLLVTASAAFMLFHSCDFFTILLVGVFANIGVDYLFNPE